MPPEASSGLEKRGGVVLVTGASSGIGHASCLELAARGFRVFGGVRSERDAELLERHPGIEAVLLDVADSASIERVGKRLEGVPIAGLVNSAGIAVPGPLELLAVSALRLQLEVNVIGQLAIVQTLLPGLRQARGRVVFMSSMSARVATPYLGAYAASKFALEAMADALRVELRDAGIDVCSVQPGPVATPIWEKASRVAEAAGAGGGGSERAVWQAVADHARRSRARAPSTPEAVARVVARALLERRPRTRYLVGPWTRTVALAALLVPDRLRDAYLWRTRMGASAAP